MTEIDEALGELAPELRAFDGITGTPIRLADGRDWLLAEGGLWNSLDEVRDRIDDQARFNGEVQMGDVRLAALVLLRANYRLSYPEAAGLLLEAEDQPLTDAVARALFGEPEGGESYTAWAFSALLANGLDPAKVPTAMHQHVLRHLVSTGRAIPAEQFIQSAIMAPQLATFRAFAAKQAQARARAAVPAGPPTLISGTAPPAPDPIPEGVP